MFVRNAVGQVQNEQHNIYSRIYTHDTKKVTPGMKRLAHFAGTGGGGRLEGTHVRLIRCYSIPQGSCPGKLIENGFTDSLPDSTVLARIFRAFNLFLPTGKLG